MRNAALTRKTAETDIRLSLDIDGSGAYENNTGVGFLNHMLDLFARHGRFDLTVFCAGDTDVDFHHTTEDIGIILGKAFAQALGEMRGIRRYGSCILPMDESLILTAVDLSGRAYLNFDVTIPTEKVGDFDTALVKEFFAAFVRSCGAAVHIKMLAGENSHHILEGIFKSFARSLSAACEIDRQHQDEIMSTKGTLV